MDRDPLRTEHILFTRGVPAIEALPHKLICACLEAVLSTSEAPSILQYGHHGGYLPLRELLSRQYEVSPDQILVGNGSLHIQDLLATLLLQAGDVVFVEQPSYDRAIKTFRRHGARVIGIPLREDGIDLGLLEQALARFTPVFLYIIPDFQNPSGITTSALKRVMLVELARKHGFWIIEDIPYRSLRYTGEEVPLVRDLDTEQVITICSYSKLISPALRVGYALGPLQLIQQLTSLAEDTILSPVLPTQAAVVEFHQRGYFLSNLERLKQLYRPRLETIVQAVNYYLPNILVVEPEGGFYIGARFPESVDGDMLLSRAQSRGLALSDGRGFFADPLEEGVSGEPRGKHFIRLPFCSLDQAHIEEGVKRLAVLVNELSC